MRQIVVPLLLFNKSVASLGRCFRFQSSLRLPLNPYAPHGCPQRSHFSDTALDLNFWEVPHTLSSSVTGPDLVVLHGLFGSASNWRGILSKLVPTMRERGLVVSRAMAVDLRNHGSSPHSPRMDGEAQASDLARFLQVNNVKSPIYLIGHSLVRSPPSIGRCDARPSALIGTLLGPRTRVGKWQ